MFIGDIKSLPKGYNYSDNIHRNNYSHTGPILREVDIAGDFVRNIDTHNLVTIVKVSGGIIRGIIGLGHTIFKLFK